MSGDAAKQMNAGVVLWTRLRPKLSGSPGIAHKGPDRAEISNKKREGRRGKYRGI